MLFIKKALINLKENLLQVYEDIEKPLTDVLIKMEKAGFNVDKDVLTAIGSEYKVILDNLTRTIFLLAGHELILIPQNN